MIALLVVPLALAAGCGGGRKASGGPGVAVAGEQVDLVLPLLSSDKQLDFVTLRGQIVVVHFFATWSLAAQADVDALKAVRAGFKGKVEVVGIALDPPDSAALVPPFVDILQIDYPVALATEPLRRGESSFGRIEAVPTTVLVDRQGRMRRWATGAISAKALAKEIRAID